MKALYPLHLLGAGEYGTDTYNAHTYQCSGQSCETQTDGPLVNTGYDIIIPVAFAGALIVAAIILLITKFVRKRKSARS